MKCGILTWNMRGLGSHKRRRLVKEMSNRYKPGIIILQETKLSNVETGVIRSVCHFDNPGWVAIHSVGTSGGTLLIWDKELVDGVITWAELYSTSLVASIKRENQCLLVTGVYGPTRGDNLETFLAELDRGIAHWELPWCIGGNFNEVLYLGERNRAKRRTQGMDMFCDFVDRYELHNLTIQGTRFTWSNFQDNPMMSKLDRFLVSGEWEEYFSLVKVSVLPRTGSDYKPLLLRGGEDGVNRTGAFPFRFQNMWLLQPGFVEMIRNWWGELEVWGPSGQRFRLKLKGIKDKLRRWNKEVFGNIESRKAVCLEETLRWDKKEEIEDLVEEKSLARKESRSEFDRVLAMDEVMQRQNSRVQWLKAGDNNTKFFPQNG